MQQSAPSHAPTILVGEDDPLLALVLDGMLRQAGYAVVLCRDGAEVLARFDATTVPIAAALLDVTMPGLDGVQAAAQLLARRPGLPVVLSSGFARADLAVRIGSLPIAGYLRKPWGYDDLVRTVAAALAAAPAADNTSPGRATGAASGPAAATGACAGTAGGGGRFS